METTKRSPKHQIVLPQDHVEAMKGLGKNLWKELGGAVSYLRHERRSWRDSKNR